MNNFLAKSYPQETIMEHTDKLIENYYILKDIYPDLEINWDILYLACLYHDLGKINRKFQNKIERKKQYEKEIPHSILSLSFLETKKLKNTYSKNDIKILAHAIAYHHDRNLDYSHKELEIEIENLKDEYKKFSYNKLDKISKNITIGTIAPKYFKKDRIYEEEGIIYYDYIKIKGLLNRIDYAASADIKVEIENNFLEEDLENNLLKKFRKENPDANWNELQKFAIENREENIIITAQTGMGKTEAGLLWIGDNKGFFTLPLKTAINAMYKRIKEDILKDNFDNKVGLLHSDIKKEYLNEIEYEKFDEYYDKTKQFSLPLTISTLDQIFDFVYKYRGFELKLATLSYSKIVIDEVQMYSSDLLAYLIIGIYYISKIGGKFAILTATLPPVFLEILKQDKLDNQQKNIFKKSTLFKEKLKFKEEIFINDKIRHSLKIIEEEINPEFIKSKFNNNKVLVICNTVKKAQEIFTELNEDENIKEKIKLFHSGFIKKDRKIKEDEILKTGKKNSKANEIWVTTQVVEASLDIDFDILITELSDLNGLFQRMGRCYRNRDFTEEGYNCYIFNGGEETTSGIGYIIDKKIFDLSKEELKTIDGKISENKKINMINNLYTTEKLKNTEYYKKIFDTINYINLIESYEKSSSEIKQIFRNINSRTVIPKNIYEENLENINKDIEILNKKYDKNLSLKERKILKQKKLKARLSIEDLTISVPEYRINNEQLKIIKVNDYYSFQIFNCNYNNEYGITYLNTEICKQDNTDDNFF